MREKTHILIVDDHQAITETLGTILSFTGYAVHTATSAAEALAIMREDEIGILLTDVRMPDMNGVELYLEIRETQPNLITFLMTAGTMDETIKEGLDEGVQMILTKPLDINILLKLLSTTADSLIWINS